jgi:hypothetical protein
MAGDKIRIETPGNFELRLRCILRDGAEKLVQCGTACDVRRFTMRRRFLSRHTKVD